MKIKIDPNKCRKCMACEKICAKVHKSPLPRIFVRKKEEQVKITVCNQCGICAKACPVGAIVKEEKVYIINQALCLGCKICYYLCPLGAIEMVPSENRYNPLVAQKCDLCAKRGFKPFCVKVCREKALTLELEKNTKNTL